MKPFAPLFCILIVIWLPAHAAAESEVWRYALGYTYLSNVEEIKDSYKHLSKDAGNGNDIYNTSISLCFQPYYQFQNGIRAGSGIGPVILLTGDATHVQVPVNMTLGYSFFMDSEISSYARVGISYHVASGDYYADSSPGFFGCIGIVFFNTESVHLGLETAYDASEIKLDHASDQVRHERIKTGEVMVFIYADF
jgi:hypothetical protein